ncbi:hypothetical protein SNOG_09908 [Parastagonospora nodorum SN15]|uniref:Uncharacterized protein n=1 Tax=Phaeosphaeria nodorum (strain SN15 / ATCC MYA-4574 / FGSC 10173) TaxID=321614 RepID=Q0UEA6_PHANO|nr:hypothetical protein SNOG_09908 [Parastagonospora nodorum SN15]EAT82243.1 hypothetical protein SNOG_09908 [Parastagonospora nodorum SN15]
MVAVQCLNRGRLFMLFPQPCAAANLSPGPSRKRRKGAHDQSAEWISRAEHNSRNVSISVTPSFPASKSTNGPSRRPEKNIVRKVSGSKARVHGRRNPVQSDLTAQKYEHKRGRVGARDKVKLEWRRDELDTSKVTGGEATQRGGVPLETSFGPHQALQYQTYLNTYRTSRDHRGVYVAVEALGRGGEA